MELNHVSVPMDILRDSKTFEYVYDCLPGNGWLSIEEARLLWDIAIRVKGPVLEVGCYRGRSTVLLANAVYPSLVHSVDPFAGFDTTDLDGEFAFNEFICNLKVRGITNVQLHKKRIEEFVPVPVAFAYLDGDHTYQGTINQIQIALQCRPTVIAIHDVNDSGDGKDVKRAAYDLLGSVCTRAQRLAVWNLEL